MKKFTIILLLTLSVVPVFIYAANPSVVSLVPCGQVVNGVLAECQFQDLLKLFSNIMGYIIDYLILPGAIISFSFAGFRLLTNPDSQGERTKAKESMLSVVKGLVVILSAWLIVKTILGAVLSPETMTVVRSIINI